MLTATQTARLERIRNYRTRYEMAAIHPDGRRVLVCYSEGRSRRDILQACTARGELLVKLTGAETLTFGKRAADGATLGAWSIRFTGRTQRDAILEGELVYVRSAVGA